MRSSQIVMIWINHPNEPLEKQNKIGSGYFVAPNLVLTAKHVIEPILSNSVIKVKRYKDPNAPKKPNQVAKEEDWILFDSQPFWDSTELDAALIRTSNYLTLNFRIVKWRKTKYDKDEKWRSIGFPKGYYDTVNKKLDIQSANLNGILFQHGTASLSGNARIELTVEAAFNSPQDWKGISGSPVFVEHELSGLIIEVPTSNNERFKGISSIKLFENDKFKKSISKNILIHYILLGAIGVFVLTIAIALILIFGNSKEPIIKSPAFKIFDSTQTFIDSTNLSVFYLETNNTCNIPLSPNTVDSFSTLQNYLEYLSKCGGQERKLSSKELRMMLSVTSKGDSIKLEFTPSKSRQLNYFSFKFYYPILTNNFAKMNIPANWAYNSDTSFFKGQYYYFSNSLSQKLIFTIPNN